MAEPDGRTSGDTCGNPSLTQYKIHKCPCNACHTVSRAYNRRRTRMIAYGRWQPYVDAEPARQHVRALMATGMGWQHIARLAEVATGGVSKLLYGMPGRPPSRRIRPTTAAALLALEPTPETLAPGARVDPTGTKRRIRALAALGWPLSYQAQRLGRQLSNYSRVMQQPWCTARTAREVAALFDELSGTPGPSERVRREARANGWAPPLAWDDIDDPEDGPKLGPPSRRIKSESAEERRAVVHRMWRDGARDAAIAERLGVTVGGVRRLRYRHGWRRPRSGAQAAVAG